jgi:RND family efflux transporter MFP subunit
MVEVRPRVAGYLESIGFVDGQEVKAGDLLFQIDRKPYQAELEHAKALLGQAETHLQLVSNDLRRAEGLRGTRAISEEEYDSRSTAVREADASVAAAKAAQATAQLNLDYTRIVAPISGKIGRRLMTEGNLVQLQGNGGASMLATIVSMDPIYCYFDVEEGAFIKYRDQAKLTAGDKNAQVACELGLVNDTGFEHRGHLDFFDNQVNPQTGTIRLRAVFANQDHALIPGMFANVRIPAGPCEPTLLVPDVAVQSDQGYKFVYIANSDNKVETRSIETGPAHGSMRTVLKGLSSQDRVIINGLMMLRPDIKVDVQEASEAKSQTPLAKDGSPNTRP